MGGAIQVECLSGNRRECGVALAAVVVALFVLGGLAGITFALSFSERQIGRKFVRYQQAAAAADAGVYAPLDWWDVARYNILDVGGSATFSGDTRDGTGSYEGTVTRLGTRLFLVAAEGRSVDNNIRQRAGTLMRLRPLVLDIDAALEIGAPLNIDETVRIDGHDRPPFGWPCPPAGSSNPAIQMRAPNPNGVPWSGCEPGICLAGLPLYEVLTEGFGSGTLDLGGATLSDLRAVSTHVLRGGTLWVQPAESNGTCVTVNADNWGNPYDPGGACGDHFPTVYSVTDLVVSGGYGQGLLVVEGDLTVWGDFHYFGVVIVLGSLHSLGTGGQITGAVMVANRDFELQNLAGMTRIQYSECAVNKSLAGSGRGVLLRERSWLDIY